MKKEGLDSIPPCRLLTQNLSRSNLKGFIDKTEKPGANTLRGPINRAVDTAPPVDNKLLILYLLLSKTECNYQYYIPQNFTVKTGYRLDLMNKFEK